MPDYEITQNLNSSCGNAEQVFNKCVDALRSLKSFSVRSRFIEIVKDLYLLKQRFPDRSAFDSYLLVDRVFAYAHPRNLPLGVYTMNDLCQQIKDAAQGFFNAYHNYLVGDDSQTDEFNQFWDILCSFLHDAFPIKFYRFQVMGIKKALEKLRDSVSGSNVNYLVIEAPTGSGKTEIMVLTIIIAALARKIILLNHNLLNSGNSPVALIIYPRRALANDQISRLIKYLSIVNQKLSNVRLTLSINYTEIRSRHEYNEAIKEALKKKTNQAVPLRLRYGVSAYLIPDNKFVELTFITCPDGSYPRFKVINNAIDDSTVICGDSKLDFIALTKDKVKEGIGDIHVTIFETLRYNLLYKLWSNVFGIKRDKNKGTLDHPVMVALDEIHTYVDIPGVRYAFMLRRVLNRIRYLKGGNPGVLIMGMSATIPNIAEFLGNLFMDNRINEDSINDYIINVSNDEIVPLGNEYFIITVPTHKAPVDALTVSIQTIMDMFFNIPSVPKNSIKVDYVKKGIVFMEEFNVLNRMRKELSHRESGAIRREADNKVYGLQDLRNPKYGELFSITKHDYGDDDNVLSEVKGGRINSVTGTRAWMDGELWWGYMLDTIVNNEKNSNTTKFNKVAEYSSRRRDDLRDANIVVSTSSLEVGVDYSDVVLIYQHGVPQNISALIQRAGRSGRRFYENPLMRVIVGIQLSPELPNQSWLFELFTRVKDMRSALEYDKLFIPVRSKEIHKQVIAELMLEYYALTRGIGSITNEGKVRECSLLNWLNANEERVINYSRWIFSSLLTDNDLKNYLNDIKGYMQVKCKSELR